MKQTPLRVIVYGLGTMGRMAARYLAERGAITVAAYVRTIEGKDFSAPELADTRICQPDVPFEAHDADVILITSCSTIHDLYGPAMRAAAAGLDAVVIAEDAFEPFYHDDALPLCRTLERAFLDAGKTLTSVGVQDTFWYAQPLAFTGAVQRLDRLTGTNICDLAQFGTAGGHTTQIGLTAQEFVDAGHDKTFSGHRGIFEVALRPLIRGLGMTIIQTEVTAEPVLADKAMPNPLTGGVIAENTTRGIAEVVRFQLDTGTVIEGRFIMCFMRPDESIYNEWCVEGVPAMRLRTDDFKGDAITVASMLNRIPDVMTAPAGFLGVDQLPAPRFHAQLVRTLT